MSGTAENFERYLFDGLPVEGREHDVILDLLTSVEEDGVKMEVIIQHLRGISEILGNGGVINKKSVELFREMQDLIGKYGVSVSVTTNDPKFIKIERRTE